MVLVVFALIVTLVIYTRYITSLKNMSLRNLVRKPCLDCGRLTAGASRCEPCTAKAQTIFEQARANRIRNREHYKGDYARRAAAVRANATQCWICLEGPRTSDPWQADHVDQGNSESLLLPAHRSCNIARANRNRANKA